MRLIDATLKVFAKFGYEAATTRFITQTACANQQSILYYFVSKKGLYLSL